MRKLEKFNLSSLSKIDGGRIAVAFQQALDRVIKDCDDRPGEKKPRTITITLEATPRMDVDGLCEDCDVRATIADNVPKRKSKVYNMSMSKGQLLFAEDSLDNHQQETMDFEAENGE